MRLVWSEVRNLLLTSGCETVDELIVELERYRDDPPLPNEPVDDDVIPNQPWGVYSVTGKCRIALPAIGGQGQKRAGVALSRGVR